MTRQTESRQHLRVMIIEDETLVGKQIGYIVEQLGHQVVGQAANPGEAVALYREQRPDLVLVDIKLGERGDGINLAADLMKERRCPMVIMTAYKDSELIRRASAAGVYGYLCKPVEAKPLEAAIEVAMGRFAEIERLMAQQELQKLMNRAKAILNRRAGLTEDEAHRRLQQESQRRRVSLTDLCRRIIESEQVMWGDSPTP